MRVPELNMKRTFLLNTGNYRLYKNSVGSKYRLGKNVYITFDTDDLNAKNVNANTWDWSSPKYTGERTSSGNTDNLFNNLPTPEKAGHTFAGWWTGKNGAGTEIETGTPLPAEDSTYYAKWTINNYVLTVNYHTRQATTPTDLNVTGPAGSVSNGTNLKLTNSATVTMSYSTNSVTVTIATVGTNYFIEIGNPPTIDSKLDSITHSFTPTSNQSINVYVYQRYEIKYEKGLADDVGTLPTPNPQYKIHDSNLTLNTNNGNLQRTGYKAVGWDTQADGSGTDYAFGGSYGVNANVTLYPRWTINNYKLTVNYYWQNATNDTTLTVTAPTGATVSGSPVTKPTTNGSVFTYATVSANYSTSQKIGRASCRERV